MNLKWSNIRPLNSSQNDAFEELCCQLARSHVSGKAEFRRKGTPDAGVECFAVFPDGTEWAWQAKYFDSLGDSQWSQLDKSVRSALGKHPRITRYFVCVPLNRPDGRKAEEKSAMDRWNERFKKWGRWAADANMSVEFVWWGSSELIEELNRPVHAGRLQFWFGKADLTESWQRDRINEAIVTAGPRYTPAVHVDLPIAMDLKRFGREPVEFEKIHACIPPIRRHLVTLMGFRSSIASKEGVALLDSVDSATRNAIDALSNLEYQPDGVIPLAVAIHRVGDAYSCTVELDEVIRSERQRQEEEGNAKSERDSDALPTPQWRSIEQSISEVQQALLQAEDLCTELDTLMNSHLLVLKGGAGTGKTHLLCDVAMKRLSMGMPTILLMGQRFTTAMEPWQQALSQLHLSSISAEEFVGALESLAQATNRPALILIDALNEGDGTIIWPSHLAAFLAVIERTSWISTILAVRTGFEDYVLPENVRTRAVERVHHGFFGHEFDAVSEFCRHYQIDLPSTPLLSPEFQNPLFLKTLCQGLRAKGECRLPKGGAGISKVFEVHLDAVNCKLAKEHGLDGPARHVHKIVTEFCLEMVERQTKWLSRERACEICDRRLPSRQGSGSSLYNLLLSEGLFIEFPRYNEHGLLVTFAYERFGDYAITQFLLDRHLDLKDIASAFAPEAPLAFIGQHDHFATPGLLAALFTLFPERTGRELPEVVPDLQDGRRHGASFRDSVLWRNPRAFSDETFRLLRGYIASQRDFDETQDLCISLAPVPDHPMNADRLHARLSGVVLPERDRSWSTFLHRTWGNQGAVDRLVMWALSLSPHTELDEESAFLCATTLTWMFTTSNRYLRDRATKALANLLTGRLRIASRIVERFHGVDDPYVLERMYAACYGAAMRTDDVEQLCALAECTFKCSFSENRPPVHILIRDYARGVVERAALLCDNLDLDLAKIRPPYESEWPQIPSDEEFEKYRQSTQYCSVDDIAIHEIWDSVMEEDFARYIIGTNHGHTHWLSLRRCDAQWLTPEEELEAVVSTLTSEELELWECHKCAKAKLEQLNQNALWEVIEAIKVGTDDAAVRNERPSGIAEAETEFERTWKALAERISKERLQQLQQAIDRENDSEQRLPPKFDLTIIQRYILARVFGLGWTRERFGAFDRSVNRVGRSAHKAERMGKKYQWIAYHEIQAYLSDHYQYHDGYYPDIEREYRGPWQDHLRDLDPSHPISSVAGGTHVEPHNPSWWAPQIHSSWGNETDPVGWLKNNKDLPDPMKFLRCVEAQTGHAWLNLSAYLAWEQPLPAGYEWSEVRKRRIWYIFDSFLFRKQDLGDVLKLAKKHNDGGRWWPEPGYWSHAYLGERGWASADNRLLGGQWCKGYEFETLAAWPTAQSYLQESSTQDCSVDESFTLSLPDSHLLRHMGVRWSGRHADYVNADGELMFTDPTVCASGPSSLLTREDKFKDFLEREDLVLVWLLCGEKEIIGPNHSSEFIGRLSISGEYVLDGSEIKGSLRYSPQIGQANS